MNKRQLRKLCCKGDARVLPFLSHWEKAAFLNFHGTVEEKPQGLFRSSNNFEGTFKGKDYVIDNEGNNRRIFYGYKNRTPPVWKRERKPTPREAYLFKLEHMILISDISKEV